MSCWALPGSPGPVAASRGLTIRYHKPTPILQEIELMAWVDRVEGRKLMVKGEMHHQGEITAVADGLFIKKDGILSES